MLLLFILLLPFASKSTQVLAECIADNDWPERPCFDEGSTSKEERRQAWAGYYDYKGKDWMEMKKIEMDQVIENGTLRVWALQQTEQGNSANYNVYYYYYVNDQAPALESSAAGSDSNVVSTQWETNSLGWAIIAAIGLVGTIAIFFAFRKARQKLTDK